MKACEDLQIEHYCSMSFIILLEHVHTLVHCVHSCKNLVVYLQRRWQF